METRILGKTGLKVSKLGLGTWVFGGWPWRDSGNRDSEEALETALECGVRLIDTAPIYGFGRAETLVGKVLKRLKKREGVVVSTKFGLVWEEGTKKIGLDASPENLSREIIASLRRLQTDRIDIYQLHWPDERVPLGRTMEGLLQLREEGKIGVIGVSNFSLPQLEEALRYAPVESLQLPFNYFQRETLPLLEFCGARNIGTLVYGSLAKGLLTGKFSQENRPRDKVRSPGWDSLFEEDRYRDCVAEAARLKAKAAAEGKSLARWALDWTAAQDGVTVALAGARDKAQAHENFV